MQRRAWRLAEEKLKSQLTAKDREVHLANLKVKGLNDSLEDGDFWHNPISSIAFP